MKIQNQIRLFTFLLAFCAVTFAAPNHSQTRLKNKTPLLQQSAPSAGVSASIEPSAPKPRSEPNPIELQATASIITPGNLTLTNAFYQVPHSSSLSGMPSLGLGINLPLFDWGRFSFSTESQISYRYKSGPLTIQSATGETLETTVSLHWIPCTVAARMSYDISGFSHAKPTLAWGVGTQWLSQSGTLTGISENFWVPFVFLTPALTFLEGQGNRDWFGGFSFGTTIYQSLSGQQTIQGMTVDLTVHFLL